MQVRGCRSDAGERRARRNLRAIALTVIGTSVLVACGGAREGTATTVTVRVTTAVEATAPASPNRTADGDGTPAEVVRTFSERLASQQLGRAWELLHPYFQGLVSRPAFVECWQKFPPRTIRSLNVTDEYRESIDIRGISEKTATAVTWRETGESEGEAFDETITRHAVHTTDRAWRYVLPSAVADALRDGECPAGGSLRPAGDAQYPPSALEYDPGFPAEVPIAEVPDQMRQSLGADEGAATAVAVAPGVWARRNPGTTPREDADSGPLIDWCSSVEKFEAKSGRDEPGSCW